MLLLDTPAKMETAKRIQIVRFGECSIEENTTAVTTLSAARTASGTTSWSKVSGDDQALFSLNSGTGALAFSGAPDFETPLDANADNVYVVTVRATWDEEGLTDDVTLSVTVTNVAE